MNPKLFDHPKKQNYYIILLNEKNKMSAGVCSNKNKLIKKLSSISSSSSVCIYHIKNEK